MREMDPIDSQRRSGQTILLLEVALGLLFAGLLLGLYLVPAVTEWPFQPGGWRWVVLAANLFLLLGLDSWRRRKQ